MAKLNNRGFFLAETIVVVGIVATTLVLFYSQINELYRNYARNAKYNTAETVHAVHNIKKYIGQNYKTELATYFDTSSTSIRDITSYNFDATGYYSALVTNLGIKRVYFSLYNINDLFANYTLPVAEDANASFLDFLKTLSVKDNKEDVYRIILILNNGNYTSIYFSPNEI